MTSARVIGCRARFAASVLVTALVVAMPPVTQACSGSPIPFERVAAHPGPIALVRVLQIAGAADAPTEYRLSVEERWRGILPPLLEIEPPVVGVCGDVLVARPGDRLVLAFDVKAFDDGPLLTGYWAVANDGTLEGWSVEEKPGVLTLADLRRSLAVAPPDEDEPGPVAPRDGEALSLVVAMLALGAVVLGGTVSATALARRRRRDGAR